MKRPTVQRRANGTLRVQVSNAKMQVSKTFPAGADAEAEAYIDQLMSTADKKSCTFGHFVTAHYMTSARFEERKEHTRATYITRLKRLTAFFGDTQLRDIDQPLWLQYYERRRKQLTSKGTPPAPDTLRIEFRALSSVMSWAAANGYVSSNVLLGFSELPDRNIRERRVPADEHRAIVKATTDLTLTATARQAARFLAIQLELGVRPGELAAYRNALIDIEKMRIVAVEVKGPPKAKDIRLLTPVAAELILQQQAGFPGQVFLFQTDNMKTGQPQRFRYQYAVKLLRRLGVVPADYYPHAGRRELISAMLEAGYADLDIMSKSGHLSAASLATYDAARRESPEVMKRLEAFHLSRAAALEADALIKEGDTEHARELRRQRLLNEDPTLKALDAQFLLRENKPTAQPPASVGGSLMDVLDEAERQAAAQLEAERLAKLQAIAEADRKTRRKPRGWRPSWEQK